MRDATEPKLVKWPFVVADVVLLVMAGYISTASKRPLEPVAMALMAACVALGGLLAVMPFVLQYRAVVRLAEAGEVATLVSQIKNLEGIATQISTATGRWQNAQEEAEKVVGAARTIAERMTKEVQAFAEFMQKMNESEKANLRLEVEKLRRGESDWLQVLVRLLDNVYALHLGALRSGQPNLIAQLGNFQNACRDAARRVGLTPYVAEPSEPFDEARHKLLEDAADGAPPADATIAETIATGYTFQGRLLRPAIVRLNNGHSVPPSVDNALGAAGKSQEQLPLG